MGRIQLWVGGQLVAEVNGPEALAAAWRFMGRPNFLEYGRLGWWVMEVRP